MRFYNRKTKYHYKSNKLLLKCPQKKAVCVKIKTMSPKKPNSAVRKIAKVRLSTRRFVLVYIPGQGHNLHDHSRVLVRGGKVPDLPGIHYKMIRGKYDFEAVERFIRRNRRSKFGSKYIARPYIKYAQKQRNATAKEEYKKEMASLLSQEFDVLKTSLLRFASISTNKIKQK